MTRRSSLSGRRPRENRASCVWQSSSVHGIRAIGTPRKAAESGYPVDAIANGVGARRYAIGGSSVVSATVAPATMTMAAAEAAPESVAAAVAAAAVFAGRPVWIAEHRAHPGRRWRRFRDRRREEAGRQGLQRLRRRWWRLQLQLQVNGPRGRRHTQRQRDPESDRCTHTTSVRPPPAGATGPGRKRGGLVGLA